MTIGSNRVLIFRSDRTVIATPFISISLYSSSSDEIISTNSGARGLAIRIQITEGEFADASANRAWKSASRVTITRSLVCASLIISGSSALD
jgi:hypothetical protein